MYKNMLWLLVSSLNNVQISLKFTNNIVSKFLSLIENSFIEETSIKMLGIIAYANMTCINFFYLKLKENK